MYIIYVNVHLHIIFFLYIAVRNHVNWRNIHKYVSMYEYFHATKRTYARIQLNLFYNTKEPYNFKHTEVIHFQRVDTRTQSLYVSNAKQI